MWVLGLCESDREREYKSEERFSSLNAWESHNRESWDLNDIYEESGPKEKPLGLISTTIYKLSL